MKTKTTNTNTNNLCPTDERVKEKAKKAPFVTKRVLCRAFELSLPVFCGYLFLGAAFGIMFGSLGFSSLWAAFTSIVVYAGSGQFALSQMIGVSADLITVFITSFFVNSRHIFYGLTFIDEYKKAGIRGKYMIFALTDETYSVHCFMKNAKEDPRTFFFVSLFDHCYWILGGIIGALLTSISDFDFEGIEFSMTALFAVILVDRIRGADKKTLRIALAGGAVALLLLIILGVDAFLLPSMIASLALTYFLSADIDEKTKEERQ